jgi:hypothetical protein
MEMQIQMQIQMQKENQEKMEKKMAMQMEMQIEMQKEIQKNMLKEILVCLGVDNRIIVVACDNFDNQTFTFPTRWSRVEVAMKLLMEQLHNQISKEEFTRLLNNLLVVFDKIEIIVNFLRSLSR